MRTRLLTDKQVHAIKTLLSAPCPTCRQEFSQTFLAKQFGVSNSTISRIKSGDIDEGLPEGKRKLPPVLPPVVQPSPIDPLEFLPPRG